ncbi:MAG: FadR family transcriptional regulator [Succinivibrio sp.]|nr:FadR family transcriptional regulator [Succinivibrio sp.]
MPQLKSNGTGIRSLSEIAADKIIQHIVDKGLDKGDKLDNEKTLCESLNVGRSTLREAVRMLASRNILVVRHGSGIYVSDKLGIPDDPLGFTFIKDKRKLVTDLLEFRRIVEPPICAMAALAATESQLMELKELEQEVDELILSNKPHHEADARFHAKICAISGNSVMPKIEPIIYNAIGLFINVTGSVLKQETMDDHRALYEALRLHDPVRASDAMFMHIIHNRELMDKLIREKQEMKWSDSLRASSIES